MAGITIHDVKVIDFCKKHRPKDHPIPRYKNGSVIEDKDICCFACKDQIAFTED